MSMGKLLMLEATLPVTVEEVHVGQVLVLVSPDPASMSMGKLLTLEATLPVTVVEVHAGQG